MIWSPVPEINDVPGWQEYANKVNENGLDHGRGTTNGMGLGIGTINYKHISSKDDTYPDDDNYSYWEITLTSPARLYSYKQSTKIYTPTDIIYPTGSIFYKNYNGEVNPVDSTPNRS